MVYAPIPKPLEVYGYHGTSLKAAQEIIDRGFNFSINDYDWLGTGVYFFQDAPLRAYAWAKERYPNAPAVIKSKLVMENCLDLLDIGWFPLIRETYDSFVTAYRKTNIPLPRQNPQRSKAHRLDCAFFNYLVGEIIESQGEQVGAIRAVFNEGDRIYADSAIFDRAHIQIAIRNLALIEESCLIEIE
ncbi:MAG: hypothetical protein AAGA16_24250, partial [Cyanobacteria bacterium P01_E01_bin.35]